MAFFVKSGHPCGNVSQYPTLQGRGGCPLQFCILRPKFGFKKAVFGQK